MKGFSEFRASARQGILAAEAVPLLIEDIPAATETPRNACLDGVASCDALVLVIGERGGWTAPSGKLVIEEEYDEAVRKKIPVFLYLQEDANRDSDAADLAHRLSSYIEGRFRKTFRDADELSRVVEESVRDHFGDKGLGMTGDLSRRLSGLLNDLCGDSQQASLCIVFAPEREDQVFDPVQFDRPDFKRMVNEVGHAGSDPLLRFEHAKEHGVGPDWMVLEQLPVSERGDLGNRATITILEDGTIACQVAVTGSGRSISPSDSFHDSMVIVEDHLRTALNRIFTFIHRLYERRDPHGRYYRFFYNGKLCNIGYRKIVEDAAARQTYGMRLHGPEEVMAYGKPRLVSRDDMKDPAREIEAFVALLKRHIDD